MRKGLICCVVVGLFLLSGCALWQKGDGKEEVAKSKTEVPNVTFYTFPDIPVPKELNLVREKSFIYETPNVKAGVLVLTGNVDIPSLENYFKVNMAKNNWRFVNSYKYSDVILNFVKDDRSSNIRMSRDTFDTRTEIWVGPIDRTVQPVSPMSPRGNDFKNDFK